MLVEDPQHVGAGEGEVARVVEEPHGLAGRRHEAVHVRLALDGGAHVVVARERHTLLGTELREGGQLAAIGPHVPVGQHPTRRDRGVALVLDRPRGLAVDQDGRAQRLEHSELPGGALLLGLEVGVEHRARVPARHEAEVVRVENRA
jgi:hypothetical protein